MIRPDRLTMYPTGRYSIALVVVFIMLTVGDFATTIIALGNGTSVELNPSAAHPTGGIRIGFLVGSNLLLLLPLLVAFAFGVDHAGRVPDQVLVRWWRHVADIFYIRPLDARARLRSPLRLVTAAMTLIVLKMLILINNILATTGVTGPVSLLAGAATRAGLSGSIRYWSVYLVLIVPCYVAGVGLAALVLHSAKSARVAALTSRATLEPMLSRRHDRNIVHDSVEENDHR